jgi:hypothetical protein
MAKLANLVHLPGYTVHPTRYTWEFQQIFLRADHLPIVCREFTDLIMVLSILTAASRPRLFSHLPCQSETNSFLVRRAFQQSPHIESCSFRCTLFDTPIFGIRARRGPEERGGLPHRRIPKVVQGRGCLAKCRRSGFEGCLERLLGTGE